MAQNRLMPNVESLARINDSANTKLKQFCLLAKKASGLALKSLIIQVLEEPEVYVFGELLLVPKIQALKGRRLNGKYFNTLNLFAYGTYKEYLQNAQDYLKLTIDMQKKLQHLTILSLAIEDKTISYEVLMEELQINNVRHLENVIIEAIYAHIIHGKILQDIRILEIHDALSRDIPPGSTRIAQFAKTLQLWTNSCDDAAKLLGIQIDIAYLKKVNLLRLKIRVQKELTKLRAELEKQPRYDDVEIDSPEGPSTSQGVRQETHIFKIPYTR